MKQLTACMWDDFGMVASGKQQVITVLEQLLAQWAGGGPPVDWQNQSIPDYLEAMAAWLRAYERSYTNRGQPVPADGWTVFAHALRAASIYE